MKNTIKEIDAALHSLGHSRGIINLTLDLMADKAEKLDADLEVIDACIYLMQEERGLCELVEFCRTGRYP